MSKKNIVWHHSKVDNVDREKLLNQKGVVLWFTGLSGSGKSTISVELEKKLYEKGRLTYRLDGDNIRFGLNSDLDFSIESRNENIRRIGEVSKLFVDAGLITLVSFISPLISERNKVRELLGKDKFIEIYVKCSILECENRDVKGLYKKAREGEIKDFTGISSPYEEPENPELILDTEHYNVNELSELIMDYLKDKKVII